jgi:hypothetical protein
VNFLPGIFLFPLVSSNLTIAKHAFCEIIQQVKLHYSSPPYSKSVAYFNAPPEGFSNK